jgi:hypothetical protein
MSRNLVSKLRIVLPVALVLLLTTAAVVISRADRQSVVAAVSATGLDARASAEDKNLQLVRVWVHGEDIYPQVVHVRPGRVFLRLENETQSDVALIVERVEAGRPPQNLTRLNTTRKAKRADQEIRLGAGEYVFYEETQPDFKGRIFVEPRQ